VLDRTTTGAMDMKSVLNFLIICSIGLVGCASKPTTPQNTYSDVANGRTATKYNLFTTEQAESLNVYPKIISAAEKASVELPREDHGSTKKAFALASILAAAKYFDPVFLFGSSQSGCASCAQLNNYSFFTKNSLIYPGVGYTKTWKPSTAGTFGSAVDEIIAEITLRMDALGCKTTLTSDIGSGETVLSDANTYFIGKYECAEPVSIYKNERIQNTDYAHTFGKSSLHIDSQFLLITRSKNSGGNFQASLVSSCFRSLRNLEINEAKYRGFGWYKERYGESGPNISLNDYNNCLEDRSAPDLLGWTKMVTHIETEPTPKSMIRISGPDVNAVIPSPAQSKPDLDLMVKNP
jgi:hypothetical protein